MMTIRGEYLWDKTGEPDPEIQELEEILGALRYQPRALELPANVQVGGKSNFFRSHAPSLAIAATIAMLLFGLGLWLGLQRWQRNQPAQLAQSPPGSSPTVREGSSSTPPIPESSSADLPQPDGQTQLAKNSRRARSVRANDQQLAIARRQEAEAAKDQLMLAFRLVSAKLNFAQKKAQELNHREPVHNQHKIG